MPQRNKIPVPWPRQWQRFRMKVLPLVGFCACLTATFFLWDRQTRFSRTVGEVEAVRVEVLASVDGELIPLPRGQWTLFESTTAGDVIARLDDRATQAALRALGSELEQLKAQLDATEAKFALEVADLVNEHDHEGMRLAWSLERRRLSAIGRKALIETDRVVLQRLNTRLKFIEPLALKQSITNQEILDTQLLRDEVAKRLSTSEVTLKEIVRQTILAKKRIDEFGPIEIPELAAMLAPIQASVAAQQARIEELQIQVEALEIRAPISGTICEIQHWPGQHIRAGSPLLCIAADRGDFVVSYIRPAQRLQPHDGMKVVLRTRTQGSKSVETIIQRVGPQVELIPEHQRRDPTKPEWGLPVRIKLPEEMMVRPGELVEVAYRVR